MKKKPAKRKATKAHATIADVALNLEAATLRRNRDQQRRLVTLGREVKRAIQRANIVRVETARALLEDSPFDVYATEEIDRITRHSDELRDEIRTLRATVDERTAANMQHVEMIERLQGEIADLHEAAAAGAGR